MKPYNVDAYPLRRNGIFVPLFLLLAGLCFSVVLHAQINAYAKVTAITGKTLSLSNINQTYHSFAVGEQVILVQMQDAVIGSTANDNTYGNVGAIGAAGLYETLTIATLSGSTMTLTAAPVNAYQVATGSVQVVSFNKLATGNYTLNTALYAVPWDGNVGGVVAFQVGGTLTMKKSVYVDASGFRGGGTSADYEVSCEPGVYDDVSSNYAYKGEGINTTLYGTHTGRGPLVSGGGGGSDDNGGGGGGSNFTGGGMGGPGWTCTVANESGGLGGAGLSSYISGGRVFMGGGGGGGQQNNDLGTAGGAGGGIVFIQANELTTSCNGGGGVTISAEGGTPGDSGNDGAGGGGAGGTVVLKVNTFNVPNSCKLTISADGGDGGNVTDANSHGGGGGGGQGAVIFSASLPTSHITTTSANGTGGSNNSSGTSSADDASGSSGTGIMSGVLTALPVKFLSFTAVKSGEQDVLSFEVGDAASGVIFTIERSADGVQYSSIGEVLGADGLEAYGFTDGSPMNGRNFYRIKQADASGAVVYSATVVVDRGEGTSALRFYPNPAHGAFTIDVPDGVSGNVVVLIQDLAGAVVYRGGLPVASGRVTVGVGQLTPGIYLVSVETPDGVQTGKLLIY